MTRTGHFDDNLVCYLWVLAWVLIGVAYALATWITGS